MIRKTVFLALALMLIAGGSALRAAEFIKLGWYPYGMTGISFAMGYSAKPDENGVYEVVYQVKNSSPGSIKGDIQISYTDQKGVDRVLEDDFNLRPGAMRGGRIAGCYYFSRNPPEIENVKIRIKE